MPVVALSGFMGSGKSVVGAGVAKRLGWRFVDLDAEVERRAGLTVRRIFDEQGEPAFRKRELEALKAVLDEAADEATVLALGGGTVTFGESAQALRERATVVHLDAPTDEAWRRVDGSERPLARSFEEFEALGAEREPVYRQTAGAIVPTGGRSVEDVIAETASIARLVQEGSAPGGWDRRTSDVLEPWSLDLGGISRPSRIVGGDGAVGGLSAFSEEAVVGGSRGYVITDRNVAACPALTSVLERLAPGFLGAAPHVVAAGETSKDIATATECWQWLAEAGVRRHDIVIALGGGVVGDLAGFVAATYLRGVRLWQVPTTLLAQVDSSVGGKVAVDLPLGKNMVGTFYQPEVVVIDPRLLRSLPSAELRSGLGEVVKYGLLDQEGTLELLESSAPWVLACAPEVSGELIHRCVAFKAAVVAEDESDRGRRAILNLGHTAAHALEAVLGYGRVSHGAAVGMGLLVALAVSEEEVGLDPGVRERTRRLLLRLGLPVDLQLPPVGELLAAAARDKKVDTAGSGFVCLREIGQPIWGVPVSAERLARGLEVLRR